MPQVTHLFSGRYAIERPLARGGMAEVFLAQDQSLNRRVAVKVLFPEYARDPSFVERFRREAQHAAMLHHPNIVNVYDYGRERGTYFIVMEYVEGQSLRDLLRARGSLRPMEAARIAASIAAALDSADHHGVVHRDIKPGNVLLSPSGDVKVTDFGIAANFTDAGLTQTGAVIGTATYFSPEQAQGFPVDGRSDVYALGVVLYEMLTGHPPFSAESPVAVAMKHVRDVPEPPSASAPDLPPDLEAIVLKALAKDVGARYQSAGELRADLFRFGRGQPVEAPLRRVPRAVVATPTPAAVPAASRAPVPVAVPEAEPARSAIRPAPRPDPRRHDRRKNAAGTVVAVILGGLLAASVIGALVATSLGAFSEESSDVPTVEVPSVIAKTFDEANTILTQLGFKVATVEAISDAPIGQVTDQQPEVGLLLARGRTVTLTVSAKQAGVPELVGKTFEDAQLTLSRLGLAAERVDQESDKPKGSVLSTDPPAGTKLDKGSTVKVAVSAEPAVAIPDVKGRDAASAQAALEAAGFVVQTIPSPNREVPSGQVVSTDPAGGGKAPKGSTIRMTVSTGPQMITLPSVLGQQCGGAASGLQSAGFRITIQGSAAAAVASQSPSGGSQVPEGSDVVLTCP